jgi:hypothetical protein
MISKGESIVDGDKLQRLVDLEEIKRLKARYCRYIDTKQFDALKTLFADDIRFDGFGSAPNGSDGATFIKGVTARLKDAVTFHHCHMPDIVFVGPDLARAVWAMEDYMEWDEPIGLADAPQARGIHGFGHYEEEYCRVDGIWKMRHLRLRRLRAIPLRADHPKQISPTWPTDADWLPSPEEG